MGFYEEVDPFNLQAPITLNCYKASQAPIPENIEAEFDATMEELVEEIDVEEKIKKSITSTRINKGLFSTISIASNLWKPLLQEKKNKNQRMNSARLGQKNERKPVLEYFWKRNKQGEQKETSVAICT